MSENEFSSRVLLLMDCILYWGGKCTSLALDSHWLGGFFRVPLIAWGVVITSSCHTVVLSVSLTSKAVATMIHRQADYPWATGYCPIQAGVASAFNWTRTRA